MISSGCDSERSRGLFLPVTRCGTGERPMSGDVKPLRWGWISSAPPAEALDNKNLWAQSCILDIDLAGHGGEEEDEDGDDGVGLCGQFVSNPRLYDHLRPPSPTCGRSVVLDGGLLDIDGASENSCVWDFPSLEATSASFIPTAACHLLKPVSSGILSTSIGGLLLGQRPRPMSALKQVVPSPRAVLGRGDREGPDCFSNLSERSPPHKTGTYV
jgi:hypothetical protein